MRCVRAQVGLVMLVLVGGLFAAEPVASWSFEADDVRPVQVEKGARIVVEKDRGRCLRLDSARARAVVRDITDLPDLTSTKRPFTAMIRVRPEAGVVSDSMVSMARMCNSRRVMKFVTAMRDGRWHHVALVFDPTRVGKEYTVYLDWADPKAPCRFTSTYPKDSGSKFSLPIEVGASSLALGGKISWGFFSLDYCGLIDDVRLYAQPLSAAEVSR